MKKITERAKKFESKKSLEGAMKYLKGNTGKVSKNKLNTKK